MKPGHRGSPFLGGKKTFRGDRGGAKRTEGSLAYPGSKLKGGGGSKQRRLLNGSTGSLGKGPEGKFLEGGRGHFPLSQREAPQRLELTTEGHQLEPDVQGEIVLPIPTGLLT